MATLVDPHFRTRLNALGDKFAARLPGIFHDIGEVLSLCNNEGASRENLEKLHGLLHGVAGSAGTFGFLVLGRESRRLEQELLQVMEKRAEWPPLAAGIGQLLAWAGRDPKAAHYAA